MSFSWETRPAPSLTLRHRARTRTFALRLPYPELVGLITLAGTLNLWALSSNGWANDYYAAAVRSMSSSWHNFLFGSLDSSGVMTVDKPPLALWIQSLSVRVFGYHSLSILVPQALIGVATVVLVYDLVRRRFGRLGGFVAGLALALTPITVAISRHNNPDALLVLCCVTALWCTVRALEAAPVRAQTRWLVLAGVAVGLGFETKMAVALMVVPGIAVAWLWIAPAAKGRLHALRQLLMGGVAMVLVGGAWPLLVELTPAADRPWISGTSDNKIISLISEYNGVGRIDGQTGGPGGLGGGSVFGGTAGPLRLLNSALGGQAGWLLGFALVSGIGILVASRLRRADPRSGWLIAVGGALLVTGVVFSLAKGIFHPYYVSLLAPFIAMLTGAGAAQLLKGGCSARIVGPLAVVAGVATELAVLNQYSGQLTWLAPMLIAVGCARAGRVRRAARAHGGARGRAGGAAPCARGLGCGDARARYERDVPRRWARISRCRRSWRVRRRAGWPRWFPRRCLGPSWIWGRWRRQHRRCAAVRLWRHVAIDRHRARSLRSVGCQSRRSSRGRRHPNHSRGRRRFRRWPGIRRWRTGRRRWTRRRRRPVGRGAQLRQAARRRHDRGCEPVERGLGDYWQRRQCGRDRRLLRAREHREHLVAR